MIFEFQAGGGTSTIRAIFEDSDDHEGARQEGPGTRIQYSGDDIVFDYEVNSIHPDLLGLLCLIIFYPFIGKRVTFPMPVSPRLESAFSLPPFTSRLEFENVDAAVPQYEGSRMALSFGGGIDSSAVRVMFPEAYVVHEAHVRDGRIVPSKSHDVVRQLGPDAARLVTTNQRYVSRPGGWHGWACSAATSLLLATDYDFGIIFTGSILGSTLLFNGSRFWNRLGAKKAHGETGNYWQSAFNSIGIPMFSPVCGASEFLTMQLALGLIGQGQVVYCMEDSGDPCLECTKCFRRDVIRSVVDVDYVASWRRYDRPDIHRFLEQRPLYFGHIFSYARDRIDGLPGFLASRLTDVAGISTDWPMRVYSDVIDLCAEQWRSVVSARLLQHLTPMDPDEVEEMQSWSQLTVAKADDQHSKTEDERSAYRGNGIQVGGDDLNDVLTRLDAHEAEFVTDDHLASELAQLVKAEDLSDALSLCASEADIASVKADLEATRALIRKALLWLAPALAAIGGLLLSILVLVS